MVTSRGHGVTGCPLFEVRPVLAPYWVARFVCIEPVWAARKGKRDFKEY